MRVPNSAHAIDYWKQQGAVKVGVVSAGGDEYFDEYFTIKITWRDGSTDSICYQWDGGTDDYKVVS